MKILLTLPITVAYDKYLFPIRPDLGLGYLATAVRQRVRPDMLINIQSRQWNVSDADYRSYLLKNQFDVVGIKTFSCSVADAQRTIHLVREGLPQCRIVVGGPHASADPRHVMDYLPADYAFQGEAEIGFSEIIKLFIQDKVNETALRGVAGLIWKNKSGEIICNEPLYVSDLDSLGLPAWDLMEPSRFPRVQKTIYKHFPFAPLMLSRGCSGHCTFCSEGRIPLRKRSLEMVMKEISLLYNQYGVRELFITDDDCTADRQYFVNFCRALIETKYDLVWRAPNGMRLVTLDEELLLWMKKSRCYQVRVGIESGSAEILRRLKKGITREIIEKKVELIRKMKMEVYGTFMLGIPGETKEDIRMTLNFARHLKLNGASFHVYVPNPGCEMYERLAAERKLLGIRYSEILFGRFQNNFSEVKPDELDKIALRANLGLHLRPRALACIIKYFLTPQKMCFLIKYGWHQFISNKRFWINAM